jgi:hypothetical protein
VSSFRNLVVVDEFGIRPLCPASWSIVDLVREDTDVQVSASSRAVRLGPNLAMHLSD